MNWTELEKKKEKKQISFFYYNDFDKIYHYR